MDAERIKVLLIEDNPGDARLIREALSEVRGAPFDMEWASRLKSGMEVLSKGGIDVVLLDLGLPDSQGFDAFAEIEALALDVPVLVLTGLDDESVAVKAVQEGAQDYLVKGQVEASLLSRSIRYALERQRLRLELRAMSLVDELTGLYNRRGFLEMSRQQIKLADRLGKETLLLYADVDGLKSINDNLGHREGDLTLIAVANAMKDTFRESDVLARLGGDEFAALAVKTSSNDDADPVARLRENLALRNARADHPYTLSISVGISHRLPCSRQTVEEVMASADASMYEQKHSRRGNLAIPKSPALGLNK